MKFVKKETAIPGKTEKKTVDGKEVDEKVKVEIEVPEYESLAEGVNAARGESAALAFFNQKVAEAGATAFRVAYTQAIKDEKTEAEALQIARDEAKKVYPSVRGPSKKEQEAQKDADIKEMLSAMLSGKLSKEKALEYATKYGVATA